MSTINDGTKTEQTQTEQKDDSKSNNKIIEPLFDPANDRLAIYPIKFPDIWAMYKKHEDAIWHAHEIDLSSDYADWVTLKEDEQHFIEMVIAFFSTSDVPVATNLTSRFTNDITILEAKVYYTYQAMMENIHSETYGNLLDTYIRDQAKKTRLLEAATTIPCIKKKSEWARQWIDSQDSFAKRLVAFAAVEGIFFSGSFCAIYWIGEKGILKGLTKSNDFIARDEGLHVEFACLLYSKLINRLTQKEVEEIIKPAVDLEIEFITQALPCKLIGMNSDNMTEYIKFVSDRLFQQLGYNKIYNAKQPFGFMEQICLREKTNFFENKVSAYGKGAIVQEETDPYADI